jgi:hypothetical protein
MSARPGWVIYEIIEGTRDQFLRSIMHYGNLLVAPAQEADAIFVAREDEERFLNQARIAGVSGIVRRRGEEVSPELPDEQVPGPPLIDSVPAPWRDRVAVPDEAHNARTRSEMRVALNRIRGRVSRRPSASAGGDIGISDQGEIMIETETMKRMGSRGTVAAKKTEAEVRQKLQQIQIRDEITDKMLTLLMTRTGQINLQVQNTLNELSVRHRDLTEAIRKAAGVYQVEKLLLKRLPELKAEFETDQSRKSRFRLFRVYARLFGGDPAQFNTVFEEKINAFFAPPKETIADRLDEYINSLIEVEAKLVATSKLLDVSVAERRNKLGQQLQEQIDTIRGFPFITALTMTDSWLVYDTVDAVVDYDRKLWNLGKYRVWLNIGVERGQVKIINLDFGLGSERQHPHVSGRDGQTICWGTLRPGIEKLFVEWNWALLAHLIWNFICSYNPHDKFTEIESLFRNVHRSMTTYVHPKGERAPRERNNG